MRQLIPLRIAHEPHPVLSDAEVRHCIRTVLTIAGIPWSIVFARNSTDDVDIFYGKRSSTNDGAGLVIEMNEVDFSSDLSRLHRIEADGQTFLDVDPTAKLFEIEAGVIKIIRNDLIQVIHLLLAGAFESDMVRDKRDRLLTDGSTFERLKLAATPLVSKYGLLLRKRFGNSHGFVPAWPDGKAMALSLSHDVDYPEMIRPIEALRYVYQNRAAARPRDFLRLLTGGESFWLFDEWVKLEHEYGFVSTFYFSGFKGSLGRYAFKAPDPFYDIRNARFAETFEMLKESGAEIGMHASYDAFRSRESFLSEKQTIEDAAEVEVVGNRHHYWHTNPENPLETLRLHEECLLRYDSSLALSRIPGFRNGSCHPFHVMKEDETSEVATVQLPPTVMDAHLFAGRPTAQTVRERLNRWLSLVELEEGVFVADFHVRVMNHLMFPGWGDAYRFIVEWCRQREVYCRTASDLANHWLNREVVLKRASEELN